jgi:two-component system, OmpR family, response regulator ArlR
MKLLIIEDEPGLREVMCTSLQKEGYLIESADNCIDGLDKALMYSYDCIILDIMLPDGSGLKILEELRLNSKMDSVIVVTAKNSLDDKLTGLNLGADDYLPKPFHMAELTARVKSVLRRKNFSGSNKIQLGNLIIYLDDRTVKIDEREMQLNRKEYDVLLYFLVNKNRLITKTSLAEHAWGDNVDQMDSYEFIYSQVKNLRKKLSEYSASIEIKTIYGVGYKLVEP